MDDNDRRRFNNDENDYYTNNSRRIPNLPPRTTYGASQGLGVRRDGVPSGNDKTYSAQDNFGGRAVPSSVQNTGAARQYDRSVPPQSVQGNYGSYSAAQRPSYAGQAAPYPQGQVPYSPQGNYQQQGNYAPQGGYRPAQGGYVPLQSGYPHGNYPQQGGAAGYPQNQGQYDERDFSYENVQAQQSEQKKKRGFFGFGKQKKDEIDPTNMGNVIITEPRSYDDVRVIIDGLRKRQAIIIDLSKVSDKDSQRILDFLSGAIYALGGAQQRINDHMFLFTPEGVMIQGPASLRNKYR